MSDKVSVVYIGGKPTKKVTILGKKLVFRGTNPISLDGEIAYNLLEYVDVFATEEEAKARIAELKKAAKADDERKQKVAEAAKAEIVEATWMILLDGELKDISKYTVAKLKTIIVAEDLEVVTENVKPDDLREAVKKAMHAKTGNPAAEV